jgi:hypothetical protein
MFGGPLGTRDNLSGSFGMDVDVYIAWSRPLATYATPSIVMSNDDLDHLILIKTTKAGAFISI